MKKKMLSLRVKIVFGILLMVLVLSTVLVCISYFTYKNAMDEHYESLGNNVARTAISFLDEDEMHGWVQGVKEGDAEVMETERYQSVLSMLKRVRESNDVLYLYVIYPTVEGSYWIFDTDESEDACPYGYLMEYYEGSFDSIVDDVLAGNHVPAVISDEDYGWIISISYPYKDSAGEMLCYVCVDISMDEVVRDQQTYLLNTLLILAGATILFVVIYYFLLNVIFVRPVKRMALAASEFVSSDTDSAKEGEISSSISALTVRSHDELGLLCDALKQMEHNLLGYIENLKSVTAERERIGAELDVATHIQKSMLPCIFPAFPERKEFDIYATMDPAKEVGGDFYDFFMVDEHHLAIVMADVSGKGVPAALFMVIGKTLIKDHTVPGKDLGEVFKEVNRLLCESNSEGLFITAFEGVLDLVTGEFRFVNAGHEMPFLYRAGGEFQPEKVRPGFVLAGMEQTRYRAGSIMLGVGDKVFQYTDGVTEATNGGNELYGMERLKSVLNANREKSPAEILPQVKQDIDDFVGAAPQFDDITMLCLEYKQKAEETDERADS
mgnify:CR=1 FL=1